MSDTLIQSLEEEIRKLKAELQTLTEQIASEHRMLSDELEDDGQDHIGAIRQLKRALSKRLTSPNQLLISADGLSWEAFNKNYSDLLTLCQKYGIGIVIAP